MTNMQIKNKIRENSSALSLSPHFLFSSAGDMNLVPAQAVAAGCSVGITADLKEEER